MTSRPHPVRVTPLWPSIAASALALAWCTGCPQMAITTAATTVASAVVDDRSLQNRHTFVTHASPFAHVSATLWFYAGNRKE